MGELVPPSAADGGLHRVPIAICGMGMRLPGGITNSSDLYEFLAAGKDARSPTGNSRFSLHGFHDRGRNNAHLLHTSHGYWLDDVDLHQTDTSMFRTSQGAMEWLDPQARLLMEVVWEAFETAGETGFRGQQIGCYVGTFGDDWPRIRLLDTQEKSPYVINCTDLSLSNGVSREFDLRGPSMTVKVGCSGAGIGLHLACQSIEQGECSGAIVAGASLLMDPEFTIQLQATGALSPEASCKSFDATADGYARAEAINAIYVKRLDAALRDGNPIRAVIRATSVNSNGSLASAGRPSQEALEQLIRTAYARAGIRDLSRTAMIECHATGTAVGDPVEAHAVASLFGGKTTYIGSVKPNLGHGEGAAAITSILKAIVSLEARTILPNIKFDTPPVDFPSGAARLIVPTVAAPWPADCDERIGVTSSGIGGTNVHIILDSAASLGLPVQCAQTRDHRRRFRLLALSAADPVTAGILEGRYRDYLDQHRSRAADMEFTLLNHRSSLPYRWCAVVSEPQTGGFPPPRPVQIQKIGRVAFVFTGQGAQFPQMGRELLDEYPSFREDVQRMDSMLQRAFNPPWTIEGELLKSPDQSRLHEAQYSQPVSTAVQVGLVNLLRAWNVHPAAVMGHSSGEIAAAYAAGILNTQEAIFAAYLRGQAMHTEPPAGPGAMAVVSLGADHVRPYLASGGVEIACINSGSSITLSGDIDMLQTVTTTIHSHFPDASIQRLRVDVAYHSRHTIKPAECYQRLLGGVLRPKDAQIPFYSTVTGQRLLESADFAPEYWKRNMASRVEFHAAAKLLFSGPEQDCHLLEMSYPGRYFNVLSRGTDAAQCFAQCLADLYTHGIPLKSPARGQVLTDLPSYPWQRQSVMGRMWLPKRQHRRTHPPHELLGTRTPDSSDLEPSWRRLLSVDQVPWLQHHRVETNVIFPGTGYISMAGEAICQLVRDERIGYTARDIAFLAPLVLRGRDPVELLTSLRPQLLTALQSSTWYDFSISAFDGVSWTTHCTGKIHKGRVGGISPRPSPVNAPRRISPVQWYQTLEAVGLRYGPRFVGLKDIATGLSQPSCMSTCQDIQEPDESEYVLHPTTLDVMLQTFSVAACRGETRRVDHLRIPNMIGEVFVGGGTNRELQLSTSLRKSDTGVISGTCSGVVDGELLAYVDDLRSHPWQQAQGSNTSIARLHWRPDVDLLQGTSLLHRREVDQAEMMLCETLFLLCAIEIRESWAKTTAPPAQAHLEYYKGWLNLHLRRLAQTDYPCVDHPEAYLAMSSRQRQGLIQTIATQAHAPASGVSSFLPAIIQCYKDMAGIFDGSIDPETMSSGPETCSVAQACLERLSYSSYFQCIGHLVPAMRVLEIGAGAGHMTAKALESLQTELGEYIFSQYVYSDMSSDNIHRAQERFQAYPAMDYQRLDISCSPLEQGFQTGEFDLIIVSNVLHRTPNIHQSLCHIREILKPGGYLFMQELCPDIKFINFIMGLHPDWWIGVDDNRPHEPYMSPETWAHALHAAGFSHVDWTTDASRPYQYSVSLHARYEGEVTVQQPTRITLLSLSSPGALVSALEDSLLSAGYQTERAIWGQDLPPNPYLISLVDIETPFFEPMDACKLRQLQQFLHRLSEETVQTLWLTGASQMNVTNPSFGQSIGIARSVRSELGLVFTTLELADADRDLYDPGTIQAIVRVLQKMMRTSPPGAHQSPDQEYIWTQGAVRVGRFQWSLLSDALRQTAVETPDIRLSLGSTGSLQTLHWTRRDRPPLGPNDVRIQVAAAALDFKTVALASGLITMGAMGSGIDALGFDASGIVVETGSAVTSLQVGDRVIAMAKGMGALASALETPANHCIRMPDQLGLVESACLLSSCVTAWYSLIEKGQLRQGQSVLIHSAAGGLGLFALQIAQSVGAVIFATVGTDEKRSYLRRHYGLKDERIFSSRSPSFRDDVLRATDGRGVDLVLNSLAGELLEASWMCVAPGGRMIELGKRDLLDKGRLRMDLFAENRSFIGVDVTVLSTTGDPGLAEIGRRIVDLYQDGVIDLDKIPIQCFPASQVEDAFRVMQRGAHMGKLLIDMRSHEEQNLSITPSAPRPSFRRDATYILVGGMGGLGRSIATWMASHGAGHLLFLSRTAISRTDERQVAFLQELRVLGCTARHLPCDITQLHEVQEALQTITTPIGGAIHLAMVLRDAALANMTADAWTQAVGPKVQGTWNLHQALERQDRQAFLVLFSSISGLAGAPGQSNYAAANCFLDSFVQHRQARGPPAAVIDLGVVSDIGYASTQPQLLGRLREAGMEMLQEQSVLDALQLAIARSAAPVRGSAQDVGPGTAFSNAGQIIVGLCAPRLSQDPRFAACPTGEQPRAPFSGASESEASLARFLASVKLNPAKLDGEDVPALLATYIGAQLFRFLMKEEPEEFDLRASLTSLGADSLSAIELRSWWQMVFGAKVTALELTNARNLVELGVLAVGQLKKQQEV